MLCIALCTWQGFALLSKVKAGISVPIFAAHGTCDKCTSLPVSPHYADVHVRAAVYTYMGIACLHGWMLAGAFPAHRLCTQCSLA